MKLICRYIFTIHLTLIPTLLNSQSIDEILNNENLSIQDKETQINNLLQAHKNNKEFDVLFEDNYKVIKWYASQWRLDEAISLNKRNLFLMDSLRHKDLSFFRRNLYSLGFYESLNGNTLGALDTYKRLLNQEQQDESVVKGTYKIAEIYFAEEQYYKALEYYKLCKSISEKLKNELNIVKSTLGIGQACTRINTAKSIREGISTTSHTINRIENSELTDFSLKYKFRIYKLLGNLYSDREDYNFNEAIRNLNKSLKIAENRNNSDELIDIYNDLGLIYLKERRTESESYLLKALQLMPQGLMYSIVKRNLANYYFDIGNYNLALENVQNSIDNLTSIKSGDITNLPNKDQLKDVKEKLHLISSLDTKIDIWFGRAENETENADYYLDQALKTIELGDYLIDYARIDNTGIKSRLFWRKTATDYYIKATQICYKRNKPNLAFYYIEKNKAILLLEDLALRSARINDGISKSIIEEENKLKTEIFNIEKSALNKSSDSLQRLLLITKDRYDKFIDSLDINYHYYFKTKKPADVISLKAFRDKILNEHDAYIEYILDNKNGYGILITKNNSKLFEIKNCGNLKKLVLQYRLLLQEPFRDRSTIETYNFVSNEIYNLLLPKHIRPYVKGKKITIAPDYYLQNIPFESLSTRNEDNSYLIYNNEISYAYSFTLLSKIDNINTPTTQNLVGFAPVEFAYGLPQLKNTQKELNIIKELIPSKIFSNQNATKETFFKESGVSKIIHFASHANANDSISPWIALYDEKIYLNELYAHNIPSELVVLSACNTSLGELHKGEGVMSLSRGFFNTGSMSVLPTLWEINDKTSVDLLSNFYKNLSNGQNKSLALHNSKIEFLKNHSLSEASPYFWASFILIGDSGTIELNNGLPNQYYALFLLIITISFLAFYKIYKKKG